MYTILFHPYTKHKERSHNKTKVHVDVLPQADHEEKKKHRQQAYQKFLTRGGAKNPGCKDIPEGSPGKKFDTLPNQ